MSDENLTTCEGIWSDLPPEILDQIFRRLTFPDTRRFAAVCRQWRSILESYPPPASGFGPTPWLMVGDAAVGSGLPKRARLIGGRIRRFFDPVERRCYDIEAADFARSVCHAVVRDWLLLSVCGEGKGEGSWEVFFFNPFTRGRFNLAGAHSPFDLGVCSGVPTCTDCVVLLVTKGVTQLQTTVLKVPSSNPLLFSLVCFS